jgi:hypothetical protein
MIASNRTEWIFNLLSLPTGRIITKTVIADDYLAAEHIAIQLVPAISQPVQVKSYM